jgi:hypothetical protein
MKLAKSEPKPTAVQEAMEHVTYDFVCEGGDVEDYLHKMFREGHGKGMTLSAFPKNIADRLDALLYPSRVDDVLVPELQKYFPAVKAVIFNDTPDHIAETGLFDDDFEALAQAGKEMAAVKDIVVCGLRAEPMGWLLIYAPKETDLEAMTTFLEINHPRWETFYRCEQTPGEGNERWRTKPLTVLPGTAEAIEKWDDDKYVEEWHIVADWEDPKDRDRAAAEIRSRSELNDRGID